MLPTLQFPLSGQEFLIQQLHLQLTVYRLLRKKERVLKTLRVLQRLPNRSGLTVRVNEICVKFCFNGSVFSAPNGQNEFSRILTKEHVIWEN